MSGASVQSPAVLEKKLSAAGGASKVKTSRGNTVEDELTVDKRHSAQFLQLTSDILNGMEVSFMRFVPKPEHEKIRGRTSVLDLSSHLRDAVNEAAKLYVPAGTYKIGSQVEKVHGGIREQGLVLRGDGQESTVFDSGVANGSFLKLRQQQAGYFSYGGVLRDFKVIGSDGAVDSNGIEVSASNTFIIDGVAVHGLTGTGIKLLGDTDPDQNTVFEIIRCNLTDLGGRGIDAAYVQSNTLALFRMAHNRIVMCGKAGARLVFANAEFVNNGFSECGAQGEAQMIVHQPGATNYGMSICRNFFEKGRNGELEIEACITGEVKLNTFTSNDATSGPFAIKLGHHATGVTTGIEMRANRHVVHSSIAPGYKCYDFGDRASNCELRAPEYNDIQGATKVAMTTAAKAGRNYIEDGAGRVLYSKSAKTAMVNVASAGTTALKLEDGKFQRVVLNVSGSHTLEGPEASEGQEMDLMIQNLSSAAVAVTFGARFTGISGFTDPVQGGGATTARFRYDVVSAAWRQIGAWG